MVSISTKILFFFFFFFFLLKRVISGHDDFTYDGFNNANLTLDGSASITSNGFLQLTNHTLESMGHAFRPDPLLFKSQAGQVLSFSTTFKFSILTEKADIGGHGFAFVISGAVSLTDALPAQYLGLFNIDNNGNPTNQIFAVEFDTVLNPEFEDIDDNHVGIDRNGLKSEPSHTAGYYEDSTGLFNNLSLKSGQEMQAWVDFNGDVLSVTLCPAAMSKPSRPLISSKVNLSGLMFDSMYVGFSSSTGALAASHYIHGWSFATLPDAELPNHDAEPPNLHAEPPNHVDLPKTKGWMKKLFPLWISIASSLFVLMVAASVFTVRKMRRRRRFIDLLEDWELEYGPHRFAYKDLFRATKGFKEKELMGTGGFGRVYKGVLPTSKMKVAVKKVSHDSRQGMKEFVAEIVSLGRLRHRNLVQLLGYCRRKGEMLLVYDFMPNGSLDKFLYDRTKPVLNWDQRFRIIKGVAAGLLYLHEEWEQLVIHRDIKASNVLLDCKLSARLGDFGLAKIWDWGTDPQTTRVVGTMGYIAPELTRTGKATTATDVFAFGTFLLEVFCGRRPIEPSAREEEQILVDWVLAMWQKGLMLETKDPRFGEDYCAFGTELVLKLGLLCSHPVPTTRPSMRQVIQILEGDIALPELSSSYMNFSTLLLFQNEEFDGCIKPSSQAGSISGISSGR